MSYLSFREKTITDFSETALHTNYTAGFVFTRLGKGIMHQTRSVRINLEQFEVSSENRRIIKKTEEITLSKAPIPYTNYSWEIGKLGKDFYETKFGEKTFSANKIKELITDAGKSNFSTLLIYSTTAGEKIGYCIALETSELLHYCYPFYSLTATIPNIGIGMMLRAIQTAKDAGKKYVYLGSATRPTDTYKLQFKGVEWFDGSNWQTDTETLKQLITTTA